MLVFKPINTASLAFKLLNTATFGTGLFGTFRGSSEWRAVWGGGIRLRNKELEKGEKTHLHTKLSLQSYWQ